MKTSLSIANTSQLKLTASKRYPDITAKRHRKTKSRKTQKLAAMAAAFSL